MRSQFVISYFLEVWKAFRPSRLGFEVAIYDLNALRLHLAQFLVAFVAQFGVALGGDEELFGFLGEGLHQGVVADFAHNEVAELAPVGLLRVEVEAVLAGLFLGRVEVPQVPVAALDGLLLLVLRAAHTDLDAVVDAGRVADDERRAVVGLGLLDDVEVLGLAGAHGDLRHIDVAVALGNHAEVFLADLLAGGGELGDSTCGGSLRGLSAGVGVHLGVNDDDVHVLAAGQDVVEAAESDVVAPTVAAEDPLALLDEAVTELEELLADVAAALLHQRDELVGDFLGLEGAFAVLNPLGEEGLDFGAAAVAGEAFLHDALHAVAHLAGGGGHTETELSVVLKERVGPSRTEAAAVVLAIRCGRSRAAIDGGAARGVGHHHLLTEELGDALEVRGLAAAGAGTAELEQRLCELAVLDVGFLVDEVVLVGDLLLGILPVGGLMASHHHLLAEELKT